MCELREQWMCTAQQAFLNSAHNLILRQFHRIGFDSGFRFLPFCLGSFPNFCFVSSFFCWFFGADKNLGQLISACAPALYRAHTLMATSTGLAVCVRRDKRIKCCTDERKTYNRNSDVIAIEGTKRGRRKSWIASESDSWFHISCLFLFIARW